MKKKKLQEIIRSFLKWSGIILAMVLFALSAAIMGNWLQDRVWVIFSLDLLFWVFLWILLTQAKNLSEQGLKRKYGLIGGLSLLTMVVALMALTITTIGLLDILIVRLNIFVFLIVCIILYSIFLKQAYPLLYK